MVAREQHSHSPNSHFPPRSGAHFKLKLLPFDWLVSDLRYQVVLPSKSAQSSDLEYVSFWLISVWANKKIEKEEDRKDRRKLKCGRDFSTFSTVTCSSRRS